MSHYPHNTNTNMDMDMGEGSSCPRDPVAAMSVHAPWANAPGGLQPNRNAGLGGHVPGSLGRRMQPNHDFAGDGMTVTGVAPWAMGSDSMGIGDDPPVMKPRGPITMAYTYDLNGPDLDDEHEHEQEIDWTKVKFVEPEKIILDEKDMKKFQASPFYVKYMTFLRDMNRAVVGRTVNDQIALSPIVLSILGYLDKLDGWIDDIPPIEQPMRFGNKAFRTWHQRIVDYTELEVKEWLPAELQEAKAQIELAPYLCDSFGNSTRIDYGTGHETNFMMSLYALWRIRVVQKSDFAALVLKVFNKYVKLVRRLQQVYLLEPAGSHGAWSLDDYQFLPWFFGSAQLIGHPLIKPKSMTNDDIITSYHNDYLYIDAINFVLTYKTGPFGEVAPILYSLTNIPGWRKVNSGMAKMYQGEVLAKVPIMQHLLFGSIIEFE